MLSAWLGSNKYPLKVIDLNRPWFEIHMVWIPRSPKTRDGRFTHLAIPSNWVFNLSPIICFQEKRKLSFNLTVSCFMVPNLLIAFFFISYGAIKHVIKMFMTHGKETSLWIKVQLTLVVSACSCDVREVSCCCTSSTLLPPGWQPETGNQK